ncbi:hypothetical protein NCC49_005110 [Naganishia albida]|nr:hypothetical protein NCC49_005110 [Naganishia albida]
MTAPTADRIRPPSFARSEFETIVRRLRNRSPYKAASPKPIFPNNLDYAWQFAGWGKLAYLDLTLADLEEAVARIAVETNHPKLDQYRATSIAGNAVWGSVFYSLPAICATADIYSPICMAVACSILFLFRPILLELGSAIRIDGASYVYLLNLTAKSWALCAAAVTLIDAIATGVVSAATAASYIKGEVSLPFPDLTLTIIILVAFTGLLLFGVRESSSVTLGICSFHCLTMLVLVITAVVHWARAGSQVLADNWRASPSGSGRIARSIFNGICIGLLGVTGFESAPTYISIIKPDVYPAVLRNLIIGALLVNLSVLVVTYAVLPTEQILGGANILSLVGQVAGGTWLRKIIVVDSAIVLCGGVLTGAVTSCSLIERLTADRALPAVFNRRLPKTGSLWMACALYLALCLIIYSASRFDLVQASNLFSMAFMTVLFGFAICGVVLKITRNRLKRSYQAPLAVVLSANVVIIIAITGNIAQSPAILALFAIVLLCVVLTLLAYPQLTSFYRWFVYLCERSTYLSRKGRSQRWKMGMIRKIQSMKDQSVAVFIKHDTISSMVEALLYVRNNENTSRVAFIHAYDLIEEIPSELVANSKLVDEAFPDITVDLYLVPLHGGFTPSLVEAVSARLEIPKNLMFIGTITDDYSHPWDLGDYGLRVIGA